MGGVCDAPTRRLVVLDPNDEVLGWFVYELRDGLIGEVVQFVSHPDATNDVLAHLLADAKSQRLAGLIGQVNSDQVATFTEHRCIVHGARQPFLAHSTNPDVLESLKQGRVFWSALEGEACLDLGIETEDLPPSYAFEFDSQPTALPAG